MMGALAASTGRLAPSVVTTLAASAAVSIFFIGAVMLGMGISSRSATTRRLLRPGFGFESAIHSLQPQFLAFQIGAQVLYHHRMWPEAHVDRRAGAVSHALFGVDGQFVGAQKSIGRIAGERTQLHVAVQVHDA